MNSSVRSLMAALAATVVVAAAPQSPPAKTPASGPPKLRTVTVAIRHRVFHDFQDNQTAKLNQDFLIGDTDWSGRVIRYVPDFAMELKTGKVISRTQEPRNPAFQIVVKDKKKAVDTTWAMLSLPPHFTRRSFLAFRVLRIDFDGREPLLADSAAVAKELESLKATARASAPPEPEGGIPLMHPPTSRGSGSMPPGHPGSMPPGHPGSMPPGHPNVGSSTVTPVPSHGSGSDPDSGKATKK